MLEPSLIVRFLTDGFTTTPVAPQYAGVQGDNGRCRVDFVLHEDTASEGYVFRIELVNGCGSLVVSDLLEAVNGVVKFELTTPFTEAGGRCTIRLIACELDGDGNEVTSATVMSGTLYFDGRPADTLPLIKHSLTEMLVGVARDAETAERSAEAARRSADDANESAEIAQGVLEEMYPFFVQYGQNDFAEIWDAYECGRPILFFTDNPNVSGRLVYLDETDRAVFEYVSEGGRLRYASIDVENDAWTDYPSPYLTAEEAVGFRSYVLPAGQSWYIPENSIVFAGGSTCGIVNRGTPLVSSIKSLSLICIEAGGTKSCVAQYIYNDGQGDGGVYPLDSTTFLRNTSSTNPLTIFYMCKEG